MLDLYKLYEHNSKAGPWFKSFDDLPEIATNSHPVRFIAYYLPQFHSIPENDSWWGRGFTEWNNVTKALPRFQGHYQPRLPADFGFYDLSNIEHIRRQVELANRSGIYGFCIHNYWHSGKRLLEMPLTTIFDNKDIPLRYCLNWANESWSRRWDGSNDKILIKQEYKDGEDEKYAEYILKFFDDERYIRINGRPLLMIYRPGDFPEPLKSMERIRNFFVSKGHPNPYIIMPQAFNDWDPRLYGLDAAAGFPPHNISKQCANMRFETKLFDKRNDSDILRYDEFAARSIANRPQAFHLMPGICPQWDNDARKPNKGLCLTGSTPEKYGRWLTAIAKDALKAPTLDERIVFINAWNEWAEGAYLEPDKHFGCGYLAETYRVLQAIESGGEDVAAELGDFDYTRSSLKTKIMTFARRVIKRAGREIKALT